MGGSKPVGQCARPGLYRLLQTCSEGMVGTISACDALPGSGGAGRVEHLSSGGPSKRAA